jgi:hypothetical protein
MSPDSKKVCETPACNRTDIVYSGTDAFYLAGGGAPTERFCYACLQAYGAIREIMSKLYV